MANFSSFFPSAGGGGGGIGQTITVGDYSYPNAISIDDFSKTKVRIISAGNNFSFLRVPSTSSPTSYENTPSSNNTYANLANITSATNGGGIYFLGGMYNNGTDYAPQFYWRITIDGGTAVEIGSAYIAGRSQLFMMGGGYEIASPHNDTTGRINSGMGLMWGNSSTDHQLVASAWSTNSYSAGEYYSSTGNNNSRTRVGVYPAEHAATKGLPYIYFSSSCLVEFKIDEASSFSSGKGYAMIKTF